MQATRKHHLNSFSINMDTINGANIIKTFSELDIVTGNLNKSLFSAWCDTDCSSRRYFLKWFCWLNQENTISPLDEDESEELIKHNLFLSEQECDRRLSVYEGILNTESNLREIDILQAECELCSDEIERLEYEITLNKEVNSKISKKIHKTNEEELSWECKKEIEFDLCFNAADKIDKLNTELRHKIAAYGHHLYCFEDVESPLFISNMDLGSHENYYDIVLNTLRHAVRTEMELASNTDLSFLNKSSNLQLSKVHFQMDQNLTDVVERIHQAKLRYYHAQIAEESIQKAISSLNSFTPSFLTNFSNHVDTKIEWMRNEIVPITIALENHIQENVNLYIMSPKIRLIRADVEEKLDKLNLLQNLEHLINQFNCNQLLLYNLHEVEEDDFVYTGQFFKNIKNYISSDLANCQTRTNTMLERSKTFKEYQKQPIEFKNPIIKIIASHLSKSKDDNLSLHSAVVLKERLKKMKETAEHQVFHEHFNNVRHTCRNMENRINDMKTFLKSGPTTNFLVIPHQMVKVCRLMRELLESQNIDINTTLQCTKEMNSKDSKQRWKQQQRLLWVYFLTEPEKMHRFLQDLKVSH